MTPLVRLFAACAIGYTLTVTAAFANEPVERTNTTALWFESWGSLNNATLVISGPDGFTKDVFAPKGTPTFYLRDAAPVLDGVYRYELSAATTEMMKVRNQLDNGRGKAQKSEIPKPFYMGGFFIVERGVIVEKKDIVEE